MRNLSEGEYQIFAARSLRLPPRDRAIVLLLLNTGVRVGELVALNVRSIWFAGQLVSALAVSNGHGGAGHVRYVPLSPQVKEALEAYLDERCPGSPPDRCLDEPLFVSRISGARLSARDIQRTVAACSRRWLSRPVTPHMLRHTFASRLLRVTNLRVVQELLGHRSLSSTMVYTHPSEDDRQSAIHQCFN